MDDAGGMRDIQGLQSSLFFETPEEIYARVFRELKPRAPLPDLRVVFRRFANADSFIRLENGRLEVRISDLLGGAPTPLRGAAPAPASVVWAISTPPKTPTFPARPPPGRGAAAAPPAWGRA